MIPAIDLMNGKIVRLTRGESASAKIYDQFGGPLETARKWKEEGAKKLHIIDLDAAFGSGNNVEIISEIAKKVDLPFQVGGGIRTIEKIEEFLSIGVKQVILGAWAFNNPKALTLIQKRFGAGILIVALDNKEGKIMIEGWKTRTAFNVKDALSKFLALGVKTFLITSISRDGTLSGPDLATLKEASGCLNFELIAAGGIGSLQDLLSLKQVGVQNVVIGKALYEGRFTFKEALIAVGEDGNR